MVARVFVNYGAGLSELFPDASLLLFSSADLPLVSRPSHSQLSRSVTNGPITTDPLTPDSVHAGNRFCVANLRYILQIMTDAVAVRPEKYRPCDCLALSLMAMKISLDHRLTAGEVHLDIELFLAAALNAVAPDDWHCWVLEFCERVVAISDHHHNMLYLVSLMPLVDRGTYLRRVISCLFLQKLHPSPALPSSSSDNNHSLLELKLSRTLTFLQLLPQVKNDFYQMLSLLGLIEYSVGADGVPVDEKGDLKKLILMLQNLLSRIPNIATDDGQTRLKEQMVMLVTKWDLMLRSFTSETIFSSTGSQNIPVQTVADVVDDSDTENDSSTVNGFSNSC
jgi:hypothetical protein